MRCPACGHEFANPTAQAGGRAGGAAKVAKVFAVAGQPHDPNLPYPITAALPVGIVRGRTTQEMDR